MTMAPFAAAISFVLSVESVSTTIISIPSTDFKRPSITDPRTINFVKNALKDGKDIDKIVRHQWKTYKSMLNKKLYLFTTMILMMGFQLFFIPYPVFVIKKMNANENDIYIMFLLNSEISRGKIGYLFALHVIERVRYFPTHLVHIPDRTIMAERMKSNE